MSNPANVGRDHPAASGADVQPTRSRHRRSEADRERAEAFATERARDAWGEGNYWRRRKPTLDDAERSADLADEPPPGWGRS